MNLYLDAGNTRYKWQLGAIQPTRVADSLTQLAEQWNALAADEVARVIACSVRGTQTVAALEHLAKKYFGAGIEWQRSSREACGLVNGYQDPAALGVDRWMALLAARANCPDGACIVVDAGTAVTVDLLDAEGRHRGGVILPGVRGIMEALGRADKLTPSWETDLHQLTRSANVLATTTEAALQAGVVYAFQAGISAAISAQIKRIGVKLENMTVVLTGGDSAMLTLDPVKTILVPDLVLEGLRLSVGGEE